MTVNVYLRTSQTGDWVYEKQSVPVPPTPPQPQARSGGPLAYLRCEEKMPTEQQQTILETSRRILEQMRRMYEDRLLDLDLLLKQAINLGRLEQEVRNSEDLRNLNSPKEDPGVGSPVGRVP